MAWWVQATCNIWKILATTYSCWAANMPEGLQHRQTWICLLQQPFGFPQAVSGWILVLISGPMDKRPRAYAIYMALQFRLLHVRFHNNCDMVFCIPISVYECVPIWPAYGFCGGQCHYDDSPTSIPGTLIASYYSYYIRLDSMLLIECVH